MGHYLMYGFIVFIALIIFFQFYKSKGKKVSKMANPKYFEKIMQRELAQVLGSETPLIYALGVTWRNKMNTKTYNYYLGLSNEQVILIKVKSYLGTFTDTNENSIIVNHGYSAIKNLSIKEDYIIENRDSVLVHSDIKLIQFNVGNEKIELKIKYKDQFDQDRPLHQLEQFFKHQISNIQS